MSDYDDRYARWVVAYRAGFRAHQPFGVPVDEDKISLMAKAAARRGDEPPAPRQSEPSLTLDDLRKQAEQTFGLSYFDEVKLWLAWGVVKRKVGPKLMNGNTALTVLGALSGALTFAQNALANGTPVPQNLHDWVVLALGMVLAAMGYLAKSFTIGSQPNDPPTPARISGALAAGENVTTNDIVRSAEAIHEVTAISPAPNGKP